MSENRISGNEDRFNQSDFGIDTREGAKSCQDLSEPSQESFYNSSGIDQGCGPHIIHNTSSGTSKDSVKITTLNIKSRTELTWWIENLRFCNGRTFSQLNSQVIIKTDASLTGWGAVCHGVQTSGQLSEEERSLHINVLELLAIKQALFSFTRGKKVKVIHFQIDNKADLSYLLKMGETKNENMIRLSKEIWHYLLNHNMAITAEYLPSILNTVADRESRKKSRLFRVASSFQRFLSGF